MRLALLTMVRNLYILKILPYWVTRSCLKNTGPGESSFINTATISIGSASTANIMEATITSSIRFALNHALRFTRML